MRQLIIYPTSRAIREAIKDSTDVLLPSMMSMGEFLSRVDIKKDKFLPDDDLRLLAMHEASNFATFKNLDIDREFYTFLQNSSYLFKFYEELAQEFVLILDLEFSDIYGEYEEHIEILKILYDRYKEIVEAKRYNDRIFIDKNIDIQKDFLANFDAILIYIEGYLSRYEIEIITKVSQYIKIDIAFTLGRFNTKLLSRIKDYFDIALESGYSYVVNINEKNIVSQNRYNKNSNVDYEEFTNKIEQIGFIKAKIETLIESGIDAEDIAVVLPDESFATILESFDYENNFNFAMGLDFKKSNTYQTLETISLYLDRADVINKHRIKKISVEIIEYIKYIYSTRFKYDDLTKIFELMDMTDEERDIVSSELKSISHLSQELAQYSFKDVYRLFLNRLAQKSIDDNRGGKITVIGLLESRAVAYKGVIIVDFNESYVPKKSEKDLFLNTQTRKNANLPTQFDRESLQKHYYEMLINRAQIAFISSVKNSSSVPSRFVYELGLKKESNEYSYHNALFEKSIKNIDTDDTIEGEYDFSKTKISASRLKTLLGCKRKYYYQYIKEIKEHNIPQELSDERDIGVLVHDALKKLYLNRSFYNDINEIVSEFEKIFVPLPHDDSMKRFIKRYWLKKLEPFFINEIDRFNQGYRVVSCEKRYEIDFDGLKIYGIVDRVDEIDGQKEIIDYKSGSYVDVTKAPKENESDFQLTIYELLVGGTSGYYDLNRAEIVKNLYSNERLELFKAHLTHIKSQTYWVWSKSEDVAMCRHCPYVYMCGREEYRVV